MFIFESKNEDNDTFLNDKYVRRAVNTIIPETFRVQKSRANSKVNDMFLMVSGIEE